MRIISKMVLAALALGALTTSASAAVTLYDSHAFDPAGTRLDTLNFPTQKIVENFNTVFNPVHNSNFTYVGQIHEGNSANLWAAPTGVTSHYGIATDVDDPNLPGQQPRDATYTIASGLELTSFSVYLGSLDNYNTISFLNGAHTVLQSYTGDALAQFGSLNNAHGTGDGNDNRRFFFSFAATDDVTEVLFQSKGRAFEFDNLAASFISTVPEPATWAMMILGFGFVGFMMRSNRSKTATISA